MNQSQIEEQAEKREQPSLMDYIEGVAHLLDLGDTLSALEELRAPLPAPPPVPNDAQALASDWQAVGDDMRILFYAESIDRGKPAQAYSALEGLSVKQKEAVKAAVEAILIKIVERREDLGIEEKKELVQNSLRAFEKRMKEVVGSRGPQELSDVRR
jgi:hypothetical protein